MKRKRILYDKEFDMRYFKKYGSLMTQGNGYLGIRAAHEEEYTEQSRGMYVAGIYNKVGENEPSDLVNLPDIMGIRIKIDETIFSLLDGEILSYKRRLNLENGELRREFIWKNKAGARFRFVFQRIVSKDDLHTIVSKITIISLDKKVQVEVVTGINAQQTNFGKQHLIEEKVRVIDEEIMLGVYKTIESEHTIALATRCYCNMQFVESFSAKNRQLLTTMKLTLDIDKEFEFEKIGVVYTSLDQDLNGVKPEDACVERVKQNTDNGYEELLKKSETVWRGFWEQKQVTISSSKSFDQLALDFALYHLEIMTPAHDERFSVGAKGLTGEGYKGHVFWDAEMFIVPFHLFTEPETAKKLLRYRYLKLEQAKEKASQNGYQGALFPWESAFSGHEETPEFAAINIRTGNRQKVASAVAEHHIVADIAYATVQYYLHTKDKDFMKNDGLTLLKETSRFWMSRVVEEGEQFSIKNVIGPDEYTEHVDNNAYTNYMAYYNVEQALLCMEEFGDQDEEYKRNGQEFLNRLYLPKPNEQLLIPQDDTFLSRPEIDLSKYKENQGSQEILLDYSREEVNDMQILKQADIVMLLYLFPNLTPPNVALKNLEYYENHTIHDSSLSKAVHAIVAARCDKAELAYRFFQEACLIDLGIKANSSDEGIHGASLGALWLVTIFGFANISFEENCMRLDPKLPKSWSELIFPLSYQGRRLEIKLTQESIQLTKHSGPELLVKISSRDFILDDQIQVMTVSAKEESK